MTYFLTFLSACALGAMMGVVVVGISIAAYDAVKRSKPKKPQAGVVHYEKKELQVVDIKAVAVYPFGPYVEDKNVHPALCDRIGQELLRAGVVQIDKYDDCIHGSVHYRAHVRVVVPEKEADR